MTLSVDERETATLLVAVFAGLIHAHFTSDNEAEVAHAEELRAWGIEVHFNEGEVSDG